MLYDAPNVIIGNVLWTPQSNTHSPLKEVIVTCGSVLTIDGMSMSFYNNTGIIVQDGGQLYLNNTNIIPSTPNIFWRGIDMMGTGCIENSILSGAAVGVWIKDITNLPNYTGANPNNEISPGVKVSLENPNNVPFGFSYSPPLPVMCGQPVWGAKVTIKNAIISNCGLGIFMDYYKQSHLVRLENSQISSIGNLPTANNTLLGVGYNNSRPNELIKILESQKLRAKGITVESDVAVFPFSDITGIRIYGDDSKDLKIYENVLSGTRNLFKKLGTGIAGECELNFANNDFIFYEIDFVDVYRGYNLRRFDKIDINCNTYYAPTSLPTLLPQVLLPIPLTENGCGRWEGLDLNSFSCFYMAADVTNYSIRRNDLKWSSDYPRLINDGGINKQVSGVGILVNNESEGPWPNINGSGQGVNFINDNQLSIDGYDADDPQYFNYIFGVIFLSQENLCQVYCNKFYDLFTDLLIWNKDVWCYNALGPQNLPISRITALVDQGTVGMSNNNKWTLFSNRNHIWPRFFIRTATSYEIDPVSYASMPIQIDVNIESIKNIYINAMGSVKYYWQSYLDLPFVDYGYWHINVNPKLITGSIPIGNNSLPIKLVQSSDKVSCANECGYYGVY